MCSKAFVDVFMFYSSSPSSSFLLVEVQFKSYNTSWYVSVVFLSYSRINFFTMLRHISSFSESAEMLSCPFYRMQFKSSLYRTFCFCSFTNCSVWEWPTTSSSKANSFSVMPWCSTEFWRNKLWAYACIYSKTLSLDGNIKYLKLSLISLTPAKVDRFVNSDMSSSMLMACTKMLYLSHCGKSISITFSWSTFVTYCTFSYAFWISMYFISFCESSGKHVRSKSKRWGCSFPPFWNLNVMYLCSIMFLFSC